MKRLVICVPTYNRSEMIEEMLIRILDDCKEAEIDIHIYDSSDNDLTDMVITPYLEKYDNLEYERIDATVHSNQKVLNIYKKYTVLQEYEYVWLCPDYFQITKHGIRKLKKMISIGFDIGVINYRDVEMIGEKIYTNINVFFRDCAWHMTSYMATVINAKAFQQFDWMMFEKKYTVPEMINHSHVAYFFENIALWNDFNGLHMPFAEDELSVSSFRKDSYWKREIFEVWADYWPRTIRTLPDCYTAKNVVIKKLGVNCKIFGIKSFINYRKDNIYNLDIYRQYKNEWNKLCNVPLVILWIIALINYNKKNNLKIEDIKIKMLSYRLKRFINKYDYVYIYGCGRVSMSISNILDVQNMKYEAYFVSDIEHEKKEFNNHKVLEFSPNYLNKGSVGLIIALNQQNASEVMSKIENNIDKSQVFICNVNF